MYVGLPGRPARTPVRRDGKVDFKACEKHHTALRAAGVTGWVPMGSTGEYSALSNDERMDVLKFVKDFAPTGCELGRETRSGNWQRPFANVRKDCIGQPWGGNAGSSIN
ncbi:dihydrodipicolinate synthase family protein [Rhizobium ruizarguesonis]|uniref:dihydrodipicolinate synthase family protein n=1 Tax=Rhizobium ruizarguesonis TaxID=2081791 RepID=UPI001FDF50E2